MIALVSKQRLVLITALLALALYLGDYLQLRYRIQKDRQAYGSVQVETYSAVPEKNNKVEFFYNAPETVECVNALFPHGGDNPCWYVNRHRQKREDL